MTEARSISSRIWFTRSTWPLDWGWKAVLKERRVPIAFWKLSQNREVKRLPWFELISNGTPWRDTIREMYKSASWLAVILSRTGRKWATLERRSITTKIALFPLLVLGNPVMKSILILSHFHSGIARGWRVPAGRWCCFNTTTNVAISNVLSDFSLHPSPPKPLA